MKEYASNATTVLRTTQTDYNLSTDYTNRRIIGLASQKRVYDNAGGGNALMSKVDFVYDETGDFLVQQGTPVRHDVTNYGSSFTWRGNLTKVKRSDVINTSAFVESKTGYNTTGSPIFTRDTLNHQVSISYADTFVDVGNVNTYAYPTTTTDAEENQSSTQYHYNVGVVTKKQGPPTNTASPASATGAYVSYAYDSIGRLIQVTNSFNAATTTNYYSTSSTVVNTYTTIQDGLPAAASVKMFDGAGRVRATAADHPNSTGGYVAQITVFDVMGRPTATSNPTEIYGSWQPAGDDVAGWIYSYQTYDWKGRPRVSTNQDGSTREATYGGCGCAGGEVITIRDEVNRYSRISHDVLGRVIKVEELNPDQTHTVYRTTTMAYNGRDQVTEAVVRVGETGTGQTSTLTYDGYGRLKTKRLPQNDSETATSFDYYGDDALQKVTDARGAETNYSYNNRHQVTDIAYSVPTGSTIAVTPSVSYTYDAAGNRTQMTDGLGTHTYEYDQLSRMISETRSITEINKAYTLNYGYNIGGEVTSISDPADISRDLTYVYNQAGRLTTVNGKESGAFANVPLYASNLQSRAWGALKHLTYGTGSGKSLDNEYNSRMQISRFEIATIMGSAYQYYADGKIKFVDDISTETPASDKFDRSYVYDQVGRLIDAKSGTEAHTPSVTTDDRPYRETFGFNEWNNLTARTGKVWDQELEPVSTQYTNNRRQGWTYDADGRPTVQLPLTSEYDASGRKIKTVDSTPRGHFPTNMTVRQSFDGNGTRLKQQENSANPTYLIRSSIIDEVVWEIGKVNAIWQKKTGFVYGGGQMLATQTIGMWGGEPTVTWSYQNPVTGSQRGIEPSELDPLGLNAGLFAPPEEGPSGGGESSDLVFPRYGDIMNLETGCTIDRSMVACDIVKDALWAQFLSIDEPTFRIPKGRQSPSKSVSSFYSSYSSWGIFASAGAGDDTPPENPVFGEVDINDSYDPIITTPDSKDRGHLDDCNRFVDSVREIAQTAGSVQEFADVLAQQFTGANDASISEMLKVAAGGVIPQMFTDEGMKPVFDGIGNQPRHFIGAFIAAAHSAAGFVYMQLRGTFDNPPRPETPADKALNVVAAVFASRFIHQQQTNGIESIKSQFAVALRKELCSHPRL